MGVRAELRVDGEISLIEIADLDEAVRRAEVLPDAELHHPPWTGERWRRIDDVLALREALDTPDARLAARLMRPDRAWTTAAVVGVLIAASSVQFWCGELLTADPDLLRLLSVGWESTLVDGAWWSPWTAVLLHESFVHLLGNLVLVGYCGWRCERAVGATGLLAIVSGALAGGALTIVALSRLPCIGASVLAFGFWGAQFAIGWRYGAVIPMRLRGYYGGGTALVAAPLLAWSFANPHVSFAGHLGGFTGGIIAVFLLPLLTAVPIGRRRVAQRRALALSALLSAGVPTLSKVAPLAPFLLAFPSRTILDDESRIAVDVPWRLADTDWRSSRGRSELQTEAPAGQALHLASTDGSERGAAGPSPPVFEHDGHVLHASWDASSLSPGRVALYEHIVATARWEPTAVLDLTRRQYREAPHLAARAQAYALAADLAGDDAAAVRTYGELEAFGAEWARVAARARIRLCALRPGVEGCSPTWREGWLDQEGPADHDLWLFGVHWASRDRPCAEIWRRHDVMVESGGYSDLERRFALGECVPEGWEP
ncbi:MAG: rhomboid family intramembrane serine protease [Myxococcales bacterium]|nr:rhomboid family intramembrane serine protease [Myxococcales bacterium]